MNWDWNKSGRIDSFYFEKISPHNINTSLGKLECHVIGGTLNYSYYSDLKVSGSLEVINAPSSMSQDQYLIRIWYTPTLDGNKINIELGTFYFIANLHYQNGMYKGTLQLRSLLARHIDDVIDRKWTLTKDTLSSDCYKNVFSALGGFPVIDGIKDKKLNSTIVFDVGSTPISILQYIADYCNGQISVNPHGQTVISNYNSIDERKRNIAHVITAKENSIIKSGLDISNSIKESPNRVVCVYNQTVGNSTVQYIGRAALDAKESRSFQNTGRWITKYYSLTNCGKPYEANLNAIAKSYLAALNKTIYYEFDSYYQPIKTGQVITLKYDDILVNGLVTDIDLNIGIGAQMHVKIKKV